MMPMFADVGRRLQPICRKALVGKWADVQRGRRMFQPDKIKEKDLTFMTATFGRGNEMVRLTRRTRN